MMEFICDNCGKSFNRALSNVRGQTKYCSHKCYIRKGEKNHRFRHDITEATLRAMYPKLSMQEIADYFRVRRNTIWKRMKNYGILRNRTKKGKNNPHWKGGKVLVKCKSCGRKIFVYPCFSSTRNFCSFSCRFPHKESICKICGKLFRVSPYQIKNGKGRFCSRKCADEWLKSSVIRKKYSEMKKRLWKDPEYAKKRMLGFCIRPTKPEKKLIKIIEDNNLPLKYVGDGKVIISRFCPDFIGTNDKKIVELFGDYWHDPTKRKLKSFQTPKGRKAIFAKHGFDALILWEHELSESPNNIIEKISNFLEA